MPNKLKSPLRYPGGKSRAVKIILSYLLGKSTKLVSPFIGGGSVELACASAGMEVVGYDNFKPLVSFWQELLSAPLDLAASVQAFMPLSKAQFYELQKLHKNSLTRQQAIYFFVLNRSSFSGTTLCGGCSESALRERFTPSSIDVLRSYQNHNLNMSVDWADFSASIPKHKQDLLYLDPPYYINQKLYGNKANQKTFDHVKLAQLLNECRTWVLSYNDCPEVRHLYRDYEILEPAWSYGMSKNKSAKELLIVKE